MAEIFEIVLAANHVSSVRFSHGGGALPGDSSVLRVRDEDGESWNFACRSEGGNWFSISGSGWRAFAKNRINAMVTLSREEGDDFYTIRVRNI